MATEDKGMSVDEADIESLRYIIQSPAWEVFFEPLLRAIRKDWINQLIDPSLTRKEARSDDFIRGCIYTLNAFLTFPRLTVAQYDEQELRDAAAASAEAAYADRASAGRYGPLPVGTTPTERK